MTYNLKAKQSTPRHPKNKSGVCLVVGTHPDWEKDFNDAHQYAYENDLDISAVCAINDATALVKAEHLVTCHAESLEQFLEPVEGDIEIHTRKKLKKYDKYENQYIWGYSYGGGSTLLAAATMLIIGYDLVILCGCPMNGKDGYAVKFHDGDDQSPRLGEDNFRDNTLQAYHGNMKAFSKECPDAYKIKSMSGVTQKIFGGIE